MSEIRDQNDKRTLELNPRKVRLLPLAGKRRSVFENRCSAVRVLVAATCAVLIGYPFLRRVGVLHRQTVRQHHLAVRDFHRPELHKVTVAGPRCVTHRVVGTADLRPPDSPLAKRNVPLLVRRRRAPRDLIRSVLNRSYLISYLYEPSICSRILLGRPWSGQQNNLKQINPLVVGLTISRTLSFNWSPAK